MKAITWLIVLLLGICASCRQPKELVYQNVDHFGIKPSSQGKAMLSMDIQLYNPNKYNLKLKKADVDVFLNGMHLGKMFVDGKFTATRRDTLLLPVAVDVDIKNLLPGAMQLLSDGGVKIKVTGSIKAGRHGIYITVPVSYEGNQDILSGIGM